MANVNLFSSNCCKDFFILIKFEPYFHLEEDSDPNRLVLVDRKFWTGPTLIPKFYESDKKKIWEKYLNKNHSKNDIKTSKEKAENFNQS